MRDLFEEWKNNIGCFGAIVATITFIILILLISFLSTSLIYYIFTIVMFTFFSIVIPFTWHYAVGVWLIIILIRFILSGTNVTIKNLIGE